MEWYGSSSSKRVVPDFMLRLSLSCPQLFASALGFPRKMVCLTVSRLLLYLIGFNCSPAMGIDPDGPVRRNTGSRLA